MAHLHGDGINVAVVDDGMHYNHEDLTGIVLTSFNHNYDPDQTDIYNYFETTAQPFAGLIAAKDNSLGMRGVAPEAKIYGYNYLVEQSDANEADAMSRNSATTAISTTAGTRRLRYATAHTRTVGSGCQGRRDQRLWRGREFLRLGRRKRGGKITIDPTWTSTQTFTP